ncbi:DUF308 domain-containing protein [Aeromicrobium sp. Sec7.5]|uniref:DUF308 domain-containing protein n=1 Tax=Aeromicrobium sp. Sec7.5 TaxID=3121276 RepID=UPI002FE48846
MSASMHLFTGSVLVLVGAVLAIFFPDAEFAWFTGRPFGAVLAIFGVVDLAQGFRERSHRADG